MENDVTTSTVTIDTDGGWKVEHFTRTWDVRTRLDALPQELEVAQAELEAAQAKVAELTAHTEEAAPFLASIKLAPVQEATSTPMK